MSGSDVETASAHSAESSVEKPPKGEASLDQPIPAKPYKNRDGKTSFWSRRRIIIMALVVVIIGLVVGLSVALTRPKSSTTTESSKGTDGNNSGSNSSEPNDPATEEPTRNDFFEYSKGFIDFICSADSISETSGYYQCVDACQPVGCCDPFELKHNCLETDTEACVSYAKCQGIQNRGGTPSPEDLTDICSIEAIAENREPCQDACKDVECCYSPADSCVASKFLTCLDYAPCQNLRNETEILAVAPPNLDEVCALDRRDNSDCEQACEPASCCIATTGDDTENCFQRDFISCLTYAPCGGLVIPALHSEVESAPDNLAELCALDKLQDGGHDACEAACAAGECCTSNEEDNCFLKDPMGCLQYTPCSLLPLTGGDVPPAPENLQEICEWDSVVKTGETAAQCAAACEPAKCCIDVNQDSNCASDGNFFTCANYFPCTVLYVTGGDLQSPPDNLGSVCSASAFAADDGEACTNACSVASCCFSVGDSCLLGNADKCFSYMHGGCWRVDGWLNFDPNV